MNRSHITAIHERTENGFPSALGVVDPLLAAAPVAVRSDRRRYSARSGRDRSSISSEKCSEAGRLRAHTASTPVVTCYTYNCGHIRNVDPVQVEEARSNASIQQSDRKYIYYQSANRDSRGGSGGRDRDNRLIALVYGLSISSVRIELSFVHYLLFILPSNRSRSHTVSDI